MSILHRFIPIYGTITNARQLYCPLINYGSVTQDAGTLFQVPTFVRRLRGRSRTELMMNISFFTRNTKHSTDFHLEYRELGEELLLTAACLPARWMEVTIAMRQAPTIRAIEKNAHLQLLIIRFGCPFSFDVPGHSKQQPCSVALQIGPHRLVGCCFTIISSNTVLDGRDPVCTIL